MAKKQTATDLINDSHDMQLRRAEARGKARQDEIDRLHAELEHRRLQLEAMLSLGTSKPLRIERKRTRLDGKQRDATAVLLCTDWHIEEHVDPETINGLNEYTPEIAEARIERLTEAFCWLVRDNRFSVRDAILWLGGDLITGFIHEELIEGNAMSPIAACLWLQPRIERMIRTILRDTDIEAIKVPCTPGNHGRTTLKPRIATRCENNFEWMLYHQLAKAFKDEPRVEFQIATGEHLYMDVYDRVARFQHGDAIRYGGGVGGITIPIRKAIAQWQTVKRADVDHFGHWHQYLTLGRAIVNGSLIGYNAFALRIKAAYEVPTQAFYLWDRKHGPCQHTGVWL